MKKLLSVLLVCLFSATFVYADSTWVPSQFVSEQYVLNKVFNSSTNDLTVNLDGGAISPDSISCDLFEIHDSDPTTDFVRLQVDASHFSVLPYGSVSAIHINDEQADIDFDVKTSGNNLTLYVNGGEDEVGIGTAVPTCSLDVVGTIHATDVISSDTMIVKDLISADGTVTISQDCYIRRQTIAGQYVGLDKNTTPLACVNANNYAHFRVICYDDGSTFPSTLFYRSKSDTPGVKVDTTDGTILGVVDSYGVDNTQTYTRGFAMVITQKGASGAGWVPCQVEMKTSSSTAANNNQLLLSEDGRVYTSGVLSPDTLEIPNSDDPDVAQDGETSLDTDGWLRVGLNSVQQGLPISKDIQFTIQSPDALQTHVGRGTLSCLVWYNDTGMTYNIIRIRGISDKDNYDFTLFKSNSNIDVGTANDVQLDRVDCEDDGTSCYYKYIDAGFDNSQIETGKYLIFEHTDASADTVQCEIEGYFDGDVN